MKNSAWLDRLAKMTPDQRERWVALWDPSRYLPAVSMPILFMNGTNDFAYPLDSYMKSYDAVSCAKQIRVTVNMPHSHPDGWAPQEIALFIDQHLRRGTALPVVEKPEIDGSNVRVKYVSPVNLSEAALHFTIDHGAINKRSWQTKRAKLDGETITATAPPAEASAWFLTVTDERGAIISTTVSLQHAKED